jgi:hypothetical protein
MTGRTPALSGIGVGTVVGAVVVAGAVVLEGAVVVEGAVVAGGARVVVATGSVMSGSGAAAVAAVHRAYRVVGVAKLNVAPSA